MSSKVKKAQQHTDHIS